MKVFHRTPCGSQIVAAGFKDNTGHYMLGITLTGVFVSDKPLDLNEGARGVIFFALRYRKPFSVSSNLLKMKSHIVRLASRPVS